MYSFIKSLETILRSLYDLLGPNSFLNQAINNDTVEKHMNELFEKLDCKQIGIIDLDDFERYCLDVRNDLFIDFEFAIFTFRMSN